MEYGSHPIVCRLGPLFIVTTPGTTWPCLPGGGGGRALRVPCISRLEVLPCHPNFANCMFVLFCRNVAILFLSSNIPLQREFIKRCFSNTPNCLVWSVWTLWQSVSLTKPTPQRENKTKSNVNVPRSMDASRPLMLWSSRTGPQKAACL